MLPLGWTTGRRPAASFRATGVSAYVGRNSCATSARTMHTNTNTIRVTGKARPRGLHSTSASVDPAHRRAPSMGQKPLASRGHGHNKRECQQQCHRARSRICRHVSLPDLGPWCLGRPFVLRGRRSVVRTRSRTCGPCPFALLQTYTRRVRSPRHGHSRHLIACRS